MKDVARRENGRGLGDRMLSADLDSSVDGVAETGLPGAEPN
jgi:hypothetical protein